MSVWLLILSALLSQVPWSADVTVTIDVSARQDKKLVFFESQPMIVDVVITATADTRVYLKRYDVGGYAESMAIRVVKADEPTFMMGDFPSVTPGYGWCSFARLSSFTLSEHFEIYYDDYYPMKRNESVICEVSLNDLLYACPTPIAKLPVGEYAIQLRVGRVESKPVVVEIKPDERAVAPPPH